LCGTTPFKPLGFKGLNDQIYFLEMFVLRHFPEKFTNLNRSVEAPDL